MAVCMRRYCSKSSIGVSGAGGASASYTLASYGYNANNGKLASLTYGNGAVMNYTYDNMERLYQVKAGSTLRYTYTYNDDNQLAKIQDNLTGIVIEYTYDRIGRLTKEVTTYPAYGSIAANTVTINYTYDSCGRMSGESVVSGGITKSYTATYKANTSLLTNLALPTSGHKIVYTYDGLERITAKQIKNGSTVYAGNTYTFETVSSGRTSTRISQEVVNGSSTTYAYTYDANGNITTIKKNGTTLYTYTYDALNRLKTEAYGGSTYTYTYDVSGNITKVQKTTGSTTTTLGTYTYNSSWGDQLKSYNSHNFTYDNSGNPLTYYNGKSYTFTWTDGRRLATANAAGTSISYQYDVSGLRTGKTVGSARTRYYWENGRIIQENRNGTVIDYYYDENGDVIGIKYGGTVYYFGKNQQGDILEIHNGTTVVAKYTYNAWGEITSITDGSGNAIAASATTNIANVNPFRYRGYYYDSDTGFYYVSNRYYDPKICRWISSDLPEIAYSEYVNLAQYNLFVYCFNNPINMTDENGTWPDWATKIAIGIGAVVVGAIAVAATAATGGAAAAFIGAAVTGLKAAAVSGVIGAVVGAGNNVVQHRITTGSWSGADKVALDGAVNGFANGFMTGGIMAGGSQLLSSGFKIAAESGIPTGRNGGVTIGDKVRVLSPNHPQGHEIGGTILKIGSKYENVRFDVGSDSLFHMNIQFSKIDNYHIPIGIIGTGVFGGLTRD